MELSAPAYRDPVRLGIEAAMADYSWMREEMGWSWKAAALIHSAWLALPKCPCCGDDDHNGIFPLVLVTTAREAEAWPFRPEKTCPKCRNWARRLALTAVTQ